MSNHAPTKVCACTRSFTLAEWNALELVAEDWDAVGDGNELLELRNCPTCRSTMAIVVGGEVLRCAS